MQILKYAKFFNILSIAITLASIVCLIAFGLNLGIDFKGGTVTELEFHEPVAQERLQTVLREQGLNNPQVQATDNNGYIIRTEVLEKERYDQIAQTFREQLGEFDEHRFESIGPVVGEQLTRRAIYQLVLVSVGIVLYIAYAFRKVSRPVSAWQFGIAAIVALLHDLLVVLGVFAILGRFAGVEIDSMFVTALLTVLGFSVHDTIIVFDRIRENLKVYAGQTMNFIVNHSLSQTLVRSLNTSLTVLFVLAALLLFGGESIRYFVLALFVGIIAGTYSSIFIASSLLLKWQSYKQNKA